MRSGNRPEEERVSTEQTCQGGLSAPTEWGTPYNVRRQRYDINHG